MGGVGGAACALPYPDRGVNQQGDKCRVSKGLGFGQGLPLLRCLGVPPPGDLSHCPASVPHLSRSDAPTSPIPCQAANDGGAVDSTAPTAMSVVAMRPARACLRVVPEEGAASPCVGAAGTATQCGC